MNYTRPLPKTVKFIKYHMRHCAVFDPIYTFPHIIERLQSYGAEHANPAIVWPETLCREWLTVNGYTFTGEGDKHKTGEIWGKA